MSYEGYEQHICHNGHRFNTGVSLWEGENYTPTCPACGHKSAFCNMVNDTNCDEVGVILEEDWKKFQLTEDEYQTCNLGHNHLLKAATYRIPTEEELKKARKYCTTPWRDGTTAEYRLLEE